MGGSSKAQTVGFRYYMSVQVCCTHGPVDAILELIGGETSAWAGNVTANSTLSINQPDLFGGEKREGGWVGRVDLMFGEPDQPKNAHLVRSIDGPVPAFRGLVSLVFRGKGNGGFMWSTGNPYFKAPWVRLRRVKKGWSRNNQVWYAEKAQIGRDMNPAHIIYECLTNLEWGMGYSPADIDDQNFRAAADVLFSESFGLSLLWMEQTSIEDFVKLVMTHIDASLRVNMRSGLFQLRLVRNDYVVATLPSLSEDDIISVDSFQRTAWGDTANEVVVKYTDRNQDDAVLAVQDLACIEAQGALVSVTRTYVGIREGDLAARVAMRDLTNLTTPLAKITIRTNRKTWDWEVMDVFTMQWSRLGVAGVPFRILRINKGSLIEGHITIEAVEDIFGLPTAAYVQPQESGWVDPIKAPQPVRFQRAVETPYWDIVRNTPAATMDYLEDGFAFGQTLAVKPTTDAFDYDIQASPNNSSYTFSDRGDFTPSAITTGTIPRGAGQITFGVENDQDLDIVEAGTYAVIGNETMIVDAVDFSDPALTRVTARRATLDTVPAVHQVGARIFFPGNAMAGYDLTQRTAGETVFYKLLTTTGKGTLQLNQAPPMQLTMVGRAERPYPPANVTINGAYFPTAVYGGLNVNWANRNREQQTVDLVPFTAGNITPEVGQTTNIRVYSGATLLRSYNAITGTSWSFPAADDLATGVVQDLRIVLESQRDSLVSWQAHDITISRHGFGFRFGEEFGGVTS